MQNPIKSLIATGPLPAAQVITKDQASLVAEMLTQIETPISNEEALALSKLLGPDDCFGLAWSLVHLIESAPDWPVEGAFSKIGEPWLTVLNERSGNGSSRDPR